jgi:putative Mg2+ transporter-C (MgtC) family protein
MNALSFDSLIGYWSTPEMAANLVVFFNIFGALLLGLLVGYERSYRGRAAGMRTYGLVCMASCAITVLAGYPDLWYAGRVHMESTDPGRVIQGIVTGIGFLGAGVIMRDGLNISGLTTAASIWAVSAVGILVGVGFYSAAILLACTAASLMMWGNKIDSLLPAKHAVAITLKFGDKHVPSEEDLVRLVHTCGYEVAKGSFSIAHNTGGHYELRFVVVSLGKKKGGTLASLGRIFSNTPGVDSFHLSHARN